MSNTTCPITALTRETNISLLCDFFQSGQAFYLFFLSPPFSFFFSFSAFYEFLSAFLPLPPLKVTRLISMLNIYSASQVLSQALTTNMLSDKVWRKETIKPKTMSEINFKNPNRAKWGSNGAEYFNRENKQVKHSWS